MAYDTMMIEWIQKVMLLRIFSTGRPRKRKLGDEDGGGLLKVMIGLFLDIQMRDIAGSESSHSIKVLVQRSINNSVSTKKRAKHLETYIKPNHTMIFFSHFRRNPFVLFLAMFSMILCCGDAFISNSIESSHYNTQTRLLSLDATKSGGREIKTGEMYNDVVLSTTSSRPVLVFYTAPWLVQISSFEESFWENSFVSSNFLCFTLSFTLSLGVVLVDWRIPSSRMSWSNTLVKLTLSKYVPMI